MIARARPLVFLVMLILLVPGLYAATVRYDDAPDAVTAHTVYVEIFERGPSRKTSALPTDFAAVAGYFSTVPIPDGFQRECVLWFNGKNLDQRPGATAIGDHAFPSDEDEPAFPSGHPAGAGDHARQDYDFDRDVEGCPPEFRTPPVDRFGAYAVAIEAGDCDPRYGRDFKFRAHLDFVDPNGLYHEVQEYSYVCEWGGPMGLVPNPAFPNDPTTVAPAAVRDLFPGLLPDVEGCRDVPEPRDWVDPENRTVYDDPLLWISCQQRIQGMFTETMWITPVHGPAWDPTIQREYTFALQVDTCDSSRCTNGSPYSFDDTPRGNVVHGSPPTGPGDEEIMRGNSYDFDPASPSYGMHRENCRHAGLAWKQVVVRPRAQDQDCYPEDHKTAQVDLYVYDTDPTQGLFMANANGKTGPNAYTPSGTPTGPSWYP